MQTVTEWFVGVLVDFAVVYLVECRECSALLGSRGQGHRCPGRQLTAVELAEAEELVQLLDQLVQVYALPAVH